MEEYVMKPIERVVLALQHKEADRVPVYPLLNGASRRLVNADYKTWANNAEVTADAYIKVTEKFGLDVIVTLTDLSVEAADFGQKLVYPETEAAHPDFSDRLIKDMEDYSLIKRLNPRETPRMSEHIKLCDLLVKAKAQEVPIVAFVFGPLGILGMLRGEENLFMDILDDPEALQAPLEAITETLIDYVDAIMDTGVHAIMLDTLFASQSIMSKSMWLETEGPLVRRIADHIHERGCMVMIHNCGTGIYFDAQIETMRPQAISFLHLPDDCKSLQEVKEKYGDKITLIGNVAPTWIINAPKKEVEAECKKVIDAFKKDGGFILATGCEYPANAPFDGAETMIRMANEYGRYDK
jgi:uroporphyrinogen decarboxylase